MLFTICSFERYLILLYAHIIYILGWVFKADNTPMIDADGLSFYKICIFARYLHAKIFDHKCIIKAYLDKYADYTM